MINKDQLVTGPFGSDACYESSFEQDNQTITTWLCFGSGFTTSTLMVEGSKQVSDLLETAPELYKDLLHTDENKRVWLPATITLPAKGMVFVDGTNKKDWKWAAVKAVEVTEEEKLKYPIPGKKDKYYKHRMDMTTMKQFEERDFMDALSYIKVIP